MYGTYGEDVKFLMVYIREAHPTDGRQSRANEAAGILIKQPTTFDERLTVAEQMCTKLEISIPGVIDELDNKVNSAYSAAPDRLYLVGSDGKIAYKGARGPRGFHPDELEAAIKGELGDEPSADEAKSAGDGQSADAEPNDN